LVFLNKKGCSFGVNNDVNILKFWTLPGSNFFQENRTMAQEANIIKESKQHV